MKKWKEIVILLLIGLMIVAGCSSKIENPPTSEGSVHSRELTDVSLLNKEEADSLKKQEKFNGKPTEYEIIPIVQQAREGRLEVDIEIKNVKRPMKEIILSAILPEESFDKLYTPDLLVSNVMSMTSSSVAKQFSLSPKDKTIPGISVGRSFLLDPEKNDFNLAASSITELKIKVSWLDENNTTQVEFLKIKPIIKMNL